MSTNPDTLTIDLAAMLRHLDAAPGYHTESYPRPGGDTAVLRIQGRDYVVALQPAPPPAPQDAPKAVEHNHDPQPYGRRLPRGECPRCDQLHDGAPPRAGWGDRGRRDEQATRAAMDVHFAPGGPHARGVCGPVCTAFDW
jgi:hypothetical protein